MTMLLVGAVEQYGATQEGPLVVPLASTDHKTTHSNTPILVRKTTKLLFAGIIGMTAAVASSALVFFSIVDFSKQQARTEPSFLLHDRGGADDNYCVVASGPWPTGAVSRPGNAHSHFVTCFVSTTGGYCWSHSYYNSETWNACTPYGFDEGAWSVHSPHENDFWVDDDKSGDLPVETCGTPCTEFSQGLLSP